MQHKSQHGNEADTEYAEYRLHLRMENGFNN